MRRRVGLIGLLWLMAPTVCWAGLSLSTDHRQVDFGPMELGAHKELAQFGSHHNVITCSSTNGRIWSLHISVLQPLTSGSQTIPPEQFRWQLARTTGLGTLVNRFAFHPFSLVPEPVYISTDQEAAGQPIELDLKYSLTVPEIQVTGAYSTTIRLTLTEVL